MEIEGEGKQKDGKWKSVRIQGCDLTFLKFLKSLKFPQGLVLRVRGRCSAVQAIQSNPILYLFLQYMSRESTKKVTWNPPKRRVDGDVYVVVGTVFGS